MKYLNNSDIKNLFKKNFIFERKEKEIIDKYLQTESRVIPKVKILGKKEEVSWRGTSHYDKYLLNHRILSVKDIQKRYNLEIKQKNGLSNKKYFDSVFNLLSRSNSKNYLEKRKKLEELNNLSLNKKGQSSQFYLTSGEESKKNFIKNKINLSPSMKNRIFIKLNNVKKIYKSNSNMSEIKFNKTEINKKFGDEIQLKDPSDINIEENEKNNFSPVKNTKLFFPKLNFNVPKRIFSLSPDNSELKPLSERVYNPYRKEFLRNIFYQRNHGLQNEKKLFQKKLFI